MGMNPPKHDAWKPYRDVRFVLIRHTVNRNLRPCRGLVLEWRQTKRRRWEAYVVFYDDASLASVTKMEWLPQERLIPVRIDPNYRDG
jgi:hypothetical protein